MEIKLHNGRNSTLQRPRCDEHSVLKFATLSRFRNSSSTSTSVREVKKVARELLMIQNRKAIDFLVRSNCNS